jgi:dTMP kinase
MMTNVGDTIRGKYIVFEGVQGAGKTTQINLLAAKLQKSGQQVHITREPGGTDMLARSIRKITQDPQIAISKRAEVLLYNAARAQSLAFIEKMLARGVWVICDRNYLSTLVVQATANDDSISYDEAEMICKFAVQDSEPNVVFIFDAPPEVTQARIESRTNKERFDQLGLDFVRRCREAYLAEAKKRDNLIIVKANREENKIAREIWQHIKTLQKACN